MRSGIAISLLLLLVGSGTWTAARGEERTAEEKTVRALDDRERTAVLNQDRPALERLWSDRFTVNAPSNQVVIGRRAVLDLVQQGRIHYSSFERTVEFARVEGDLAVLMGAETVRPIGGAPLAGQTVKRRFTNIWKRQGGTWWLIARHANVIPAR
jgi:ketosteroid isomerase-like protein